jgi:hypothetical protein
LTVRLTLYVLIIARLLHSRHITLPHMHHLIGLEDCWRLAAFTYRPHSLTLGVYDAPSPMKWLATNNTDPIAAALLLNNIASAWNENTIRYTSTQSCSKLDCIEADALLNFLRQFPQVATDFLVNKALLVETDQAFDMTPQSSRPMLEQWVHTSDGRVSKNEWHLNEWSLKETANSKEEWQFGRFLKPELLQDANFVTKLFSITTGVKEPLKDSKYMTLLSDVLELLGIAKSKACPTVNISPLGVPLRGFHTIKVLEVACSIVADQRSADVFKVM